MSKSHLPAQTPARGPNEHASDAPVTRSHLRGAAGFTLSPSTGGTKTGKFTVIPDVTTPLRTGKLVSHDLSSDDRARLDTIIGLLRSAGGGLPEQSIRSTAFQAAAFTVEEAIQDPRRAPQATGAACRGVPRRAATCCGVLCAAVCCGVPQHLIP